MDWWLAHIATVITVTDLLRRQARTPLASFGKHAGIQRIPAFWVGAVRRDVRLDQSCVAKLSYASTTGARLPRTPDPML